MSQYVGNHKTIARKLKLFENDHCVYLVKTTYNTTQKNFSLTKLLFLVQLALQNMCHIPSVLAPCWVIRCLQHCCQATVQNLTETDLTDGTKKRHNKLQIKKAAVGLNSGCPNKHRWTDIYLTTQRRCCLHIIEEEQRSKLVK